LSRSLRWRSRRRIGRTGHFVKTKAGVVIVVVKRTTKSTSVVVVIVEPTAKTTAVIIVVVEGASAESPTAVVVIIVESTATKSTSGVVVVVVERAVSEPTASVVVVIVEPSTKSTTSIVVVIVEPSTKSTASIVVVIVESTFATTSVVIVVVESTVPATGVIIVVIERIAREGPRGQENDRSLEATVEALSIFYVLYVCVLCGGWLDRGPIIEPCTKSTSGVIIVVVEVIATAAGVIVVVVEIITTAAGVVVVVVKRVTTDWLSREENDRGLEAAVEALFVSVGGWFSNRTLIVVVVHDKRTERATVVAVLIDKSLA